MVTIEEQYRKLQLDLANQLYLVPYATRKYKMALASQYVIEYEDFTFNLKNKVWAIRSKHVAVEDKDSSTYYSVLLPVVIEQDEMCPALLEALKKAVTRFKEQDRKDEVYGKMIKLKEALS